MEQKILDEVLGKIAELQTEIAELQYKVALAVLKSGLNEAPDCSIQVRRLLGDTASDRDVQRFDGLIRMFPELVFSQELVGVLLKKMYLLKPFEGHKRLWNALMRRGFYCLADLVLYLDWSDLRKYSFGGRRVGSKGAELLKEKLRELAAETPELVPILAPLIEN